MTLLTRQTALWCSASLLALVSMTSVIGQEAVQDSPAIARPPVEDALAYADLLYSREQFGIAAQQYQTFIKENPESPNLAIAWFRLGECYLKAKQTDDAVASFEYLVSTFKRGSYVGSGAYRLAVIKFEAKDYAAAIPHFSLAAEELTNEEAKTQALFYSARSLQLIDKPKEALAGYEAVMKAASAESNPFFERCLLESARLHFELGNTDAALDGFRDLAKTSEKKEYREEAIVRAALLAADAGKAEESEKLIDQALRFPDTSPWKSLAQISAIFNAFAAGNYDRVIALYNTGVYTPQKESRAKLLLVVGHSFRINGDTEAALRLYSLVEAKYTKSAEGIEAGYRRLQLLHQNGDGMLPEAARRYAQKQAKNNPDSKYIDLAWLMAAEFHFNKAENSASGPGSKFAKKHYGDAAKAYAKVRPDKVDENYREVRLYKLGWSQLESGDEQEGLLTLSRFTQRHRKSAYASSALAKKAMVYQARGDLQFALGDFESLAKSYPDAPETEFAMQQIALIYAHQKKTPKMIDAYQKLLKKFPKTQGAGEAHYWIGVGHFELDDHKRAIPSLEKARQLDPAYDDRATLRIVICHYQLENLDQLVSEAKRYIDATPSGEAASSSSRAEIPPQVVEYLGRKLSADGDYKSAEYFLSLICDPEEPKTSSADVWKLLAESRAELKNHFDAIIAYDEYLKRTERPSERASAYLMRGKSQLSVRDFDSARDSAQESLRSQKEGRTNAEARLLLGDIAAEQGNLEQAAREYLVVSQIFSDPEITPLALTKAISAYRSLGNAEKAAQFEAELKKEFPNYKPSA